MQKFRSLYYKQILWHLWRFMVYIHISTATFISFSGFFSPSLMSVKDTAVDQHVGPVPISCESYTFYLFFSQEAHAEAARLLRGRGKRERGDHNVWAQYRRSREEWGYRVRPPPGTYMLRETVKAPNEHVRLVERKKNEMHILQRIFCSDKWSVTFILKFGKKIINSRKKYSKLDKYVFGFSIFYLGGGQHLERPNLEGRYFGILKFWI